MLQCHFHGRRVQILLNTKTTMSITTLLLVMFFLVVTTLVNAFVPPAVSSYNSHHIRIVMQQPTRCKSRLRSNQQKASSSAFDPSSKESSSSSSTASSLIKEQEQEEEEEEGPDMKAYAAAYRTVFEEMPCRDCTTSTAIQGQIPNDLQGTYYRVGPAMFSAGSIIPPKKSILQPKQLPVPDGQDVSRMVRHPFEGDGGVFAITFGSSNSDGSSSKRDVTARFRFVRTTGFTNERRKGQKVYKAMEATRNMPLVASNSGSSSSSIVNDWHLPLYRHHLQPGLNKNRKNTSNTRTIYWGKRLLTLWQGGLPYKLDAMALSTEGRSQLGGAIESEEDSLGCKMVVDAAQNRALFFGVSWPSPQKSQVVFYEFNEQFRLVDKDDNDNKNKNGNKQNGRLSVELPGFAILNDFTATRDYYILVQPNVIVADAMQYLISKDPSRVLKIQNDQSCIMHLIPRVGSNSSSKKRQMLSIPIPRDGDGDDDDIGMDRNLQFINSYQEGDLVVVDAIRSSPAKGKDSSKQQQLATWPWVDSLESYQAGTSLKSPWRYIVDTRTGSISKKPLLSSSARHESCSFGVIHPSYSTLPHRYIYMNVGRLKDEPSPPQGIARLDCTTGEMTSWMPERHEYCGEPMFAPPTTTAASNDNDDNNNGAVDDKETRGYIISVLWNGKTRESQVVILNAQDVTAGPVARIPLGMAIPHGLFGCFTKSPEATWSLDAIDRRAKLDDKMESRGDMWNVVKSDFSGLGLRLDDMPEYFGDFFE